MKKIIYTTAFKCDAKRMQKRAKDFKKLEEVLSILIKGESLPVKYKNHKLKGFFFRMLGMSFGAGLVINLRPLRD